MSVHIPHRPSQTFTDLHRHCAPPFHSVRILTTTIFGAHAHRHCAQTFTALHRPSQTFTAFHRPSPPLRTASLCAFCAHSSPTSVEVLPPVGTAPHRMRTDAHRLSTLLYPFNNSYTFCSIQFLRCCDGHDDEKDNRSDSSSNYR